LDGILNIHKPSGKTSYDVVAVVKRLSGVRRVGHAGTLDPAATGVLPVCLGRGTRVIEFLAEASKTYRARITLGVETDTYDATGRIVREADPSGITLAHIEPALVPFRGFIEQVPPLYSAVKHRGKRLYELARAGIEVERRSRPAVIHRLEVLDWQPPVLTVEVECGKGTYLRSLAHDLGQSLGCGAMLQDLVRTRYGPFPIESAVPLSRLEAAFSHGYWLHYLYPVDEVILGWDAAVVGAETERRVLNGMSLTLPPPGDDARCRAYSADGQLLGVLRFDRESAQWRPDKVLFSRGLRGLRPLWREGQG